MRYIRKYFCYFLAFVVLAIYYIFSTSKELSLEKEIKRQKEQCGKLPHEGNITIDNVIWQVLEIPKGFYKLMNAYLDERQDQKIVRVSVIGNRLNISEDAIYCQFWFDENPETQPNVVKATQFILMWLECKFL